MQRLSVFAAILLVGCRYEDKTESFIFQGERVQVSPTAKGVEIPLDASLFERVPDQKTKQEIARSLGRIPLTNVPIARIVVPFKPDDTRCRVVLRQSTFSQVALYLKRYDDGVWRIDEAEHETN